MRGELPRVELLAVVRHLLTRCPECVEVTRRLWQLGELPGWRTRLREILGLFGGMAPDEAA